jgi:hypothetical protein
MPPPVDLIDTSAVRSGVGNRIGKLSGVLDDSGDGVGALKAASRAIGAVAPLVQAAESKARNALSIHPGTTAKITSARSSRLTARATLMSLGFDAAASLVFRDDSKAVSVATTLAVEEIIHRINEWPSELRASLVDGDLSIENVRGGRVRVELTGDFDGVGLELLFGDAVKAGATAVEAFGTWNEARFELGQEFEALQRDIEAAVRRADHKGVNLLEGGRVSLALLDGAPSVLEVKGETIAAAGSAAAALATANGWQSDGEIRSALAALSAARGRLHTLADTVQESLSQVHRRAGFGRAAAAGPRAELGRSESGDQADAASRLARELRAQLAQTTTPLTTAPEHAALRSF